MNLRKVTPNSWTEPRNAHRSLLLNNSFLQIVHSYLPCVSINASLFLRNQLTTILAFIKSNVDGWYCVLWVIASSDIYVNCHAISQSIRRAVCVLCWKIEIVMKWSCIMAKGGMKIKISVCSNVRKNKYFKSNYYDSKTINHAGLL